MEYLAVEIKEFSETAPVSGTKLAKRVTRDPGAGEVQVKMMLAAVNPSDVFSLQGIYPRMGRDLPAVPGFDGVGVVTKIGPGVEGFAPGQRVTARPWRADKGDGSWQQYTTIPANLLVPVPDAVSDEVAAQFYINPVTVVGLLEETAVPKGGYLIVTAAGSTLSKMLLSMAKSQGIKTIAVVRRQEQAQEILSAGADHVVCSTTEDLVARVKEITGGVGADAAADSVGGPLAEQLGNSLKTGGVVLIYGIMDGASFTGSAIGVLFNGIVYKGFWMEPWLSGLGPKGQAVVMTKTMDALAAGAMTPDVGKVYPLERYQEAVEESAKTARGGKVLIKLN